MHRGLPFPFPSPIITKCGGNLRNILPIAILSKYKNDRNDIIKLVNSDIQPTTDTSQDISEKNHDITPPMNPPGIFIIGGEGSQAALHNLYHFEEDLIKPFAGFFVVNLP